MSEVSGCGVPRVRAGWRTKKGKGKGKGASTSQGDTVEGIQIELALITDDSFGENHKGTLSPQFPL